VTGGGEAIAGPGLLSPLLARLRYRRADRLIPESHRGGRILDVGCGEWPAFLAGTRFREKHGIDRRAPRAALPAGVVVLQHDVVERGLPWSDAFFDVVTLLAVVEHLDPVAALALLREVRRVVVDRGLAILTLPSWQGDALLHVLAPLGITSREQHEEHADAYSPAKLRALLVESGFDAPAVEVGRFELGLNLWARATKR
jgi:SAM-dependent methyltransferase